MPVISPGGGSSNAATQRKKNGLAGLKYQIVLIPHLRPPAYPLNRVITIRTEREACRHKLYIYIDRYDGKDAETPPHLPARRMMTFSMLSRVKGRLLSGLPLSTDTLRCRHNAAKSV